MSRTRDAGSTRTHVRRLEVGGSDLVAKSVRGRARSHLRREAEVLGHLEGVPVVELVALRDNDDRTDLVTLDAGAHDLSNPVGLRPALLLTSIAEAADALDQLHRAGWVHGAFCGEHIVVDHGGRATLCSLGSAVPHAAGEHGVADDLEQLRRLIDRLASRRDPTWTSAELRWWRRRSRRLVRVLARSGSWTADAAQIAAITRSFDPPTSGSGSQDHPGAGNPALRLGRAPTGLLLGIITIAATALLWTGRSPTVAGSSSTDDSTPTTTTITTTTTTTTPGGATGCTDDPGTDEAVDLDGDGCVEPVTVEGNEVRSRTSVVRAGTAGDEVAIASPGCTGPPRVVLLRPSTGEVFVFEDPPTTDRPAAATLLVTTGPGALDVDDRAGCRDVTVRHPDGSFSEVPAPPTHRSPTQDADP